MGAGFRNHSWYGYAFAGSRLLAAIALFGLIGLVAIFTSQITQGSVAPPPQLTAVIAVSGAALLWVLLSFTAYEDTHFPYMVTAIIDTVFLIPFAVMVIVIGGQLSETDCSTLPAPSGDGPLSFASLVASDQMNCYMVQSTWGLSIALCALFLTSAATAAFLFLRKRKDGYNGKFFGKNSARYGKPIKGTKSPESSTNHSVRSARSAGPGSPENSKKSKQKTQQENGQYQSYDKGYRIFKPSTWYLSHKSSANSPSSTSRGVISSGPSVNSLSARNVTIPKQAPDSSPSKNYAEPQTRSNKNTGNWTPVFGWPWRTAGPGRGSNGPDCSKNTAPPGLQPGIRLTDMSHVPQGHSNGPKTTDSDGLWDHQPTSKGNGFLVLLGSRAESGDNAYHHPQANRSLDPQRQLPTPSYQKGNVAGQSDMGKKVASARNGGGSGPPHQANMRGQQPPDPSAGMAPEGIAIPKAGVKNSRTLAHYHGSTPPLDQGLIASSMATGKNNNNVTDLNRRNVGGKELTRRGQPQAAGVITAEPEADGSGITGLQRDAQKRDQWYRMHKSTAENTAAKYPPPGTQLPGAGPNGPNGQNLQRQQTLKSTPLVPDQPQDSLQKPVINAEAVPPSNQRSFLSKVRSVFVSTTPAKPGKGIPPGSSGNGIPPGSSIRDPPNTQHEGRNLPNTSVQQDGTLLPNSQLLQRDNNGAQPSNGAQPPNGIQPQGNRNLRAPDTSRIVAAKKNDQMRTDQIIMEPPARLLPQEKPPRSETGTGAPAPEAALGKLSRQPARLGKSGRPGRLDGGNVQESSSNQPTDRPVLDTGVYPVPEAQHRTRPAGSQVKQLLTGSEALPTHQPERTQGAPSQIPHNPDPGASPSLSDGDALPGLPGKQQPVLGEQSLRRHAAAGPAGKQAVSALPVLVRPTHGQPTHGQPTHGQPTHGQPTHELPTAPATRGPQPPPQPSIRPGALPPSAWDQPGHPAMQVEPKKFMVPAENDRLRDGAAPMPIAQKVQPTIKMNSRVKRQADPKATGNTIPQPLSLENVATVNTSSRPRGPRDRPDVSQHDLGESFEPEPLRLGDKNPHAAAGALPPPKFPPPSRNLPKPAPAPETKRTPVPVQQKPLQKKSPPPPQQKQDRPLVPPLMHSGQADPVPPSEAGRSALRPLTISNDTRAREGPEPAPQARGLQNAPNDVTPKEMIPRGRPPQMTAASQPKTGNEPGGAANNSKEQRNMPVKATTDLPPSGPIIHPGSVSPGSRDQKRPPPPRMDARAHGGDRQAPFPSIESVTSAGPSSVTESSSNLGGLLGLFKGKKKDNTRNDRKSDETTTASDLPRKPLGQPSLLPKGKTPDSFRRHASPPAAPPAALPVVAGGEVRPDQGGPALSSQRRHQQGRDLKRGPDPSPPQNAADGEASKPLVNRDTPQSRNGMQDTSNQPVDQPRAGAQAFPLVREGQRRSPPMHTAANNSEPYRDPDKQGGKRLDRNAHVHAETVRTMEPVPIRHGSVPAAAQPPSSRKTVETSITDGTKLPPVLVTDNNQERDANRDMKGLDAIESQRRPVPGFPKKPPAPSDGRSRDGQPKDGQPKDGQPDSNGRPQSPSIPSTGLQVPVNSDKPSLLQPGVSGGTPLRQRGPVDKPATGKDRPTPTGPRGGLPPTPTPRGKENDTKSSLSAPSNGLQEPQQQMPAQPIPGGRRDKPNTENDVPPPLSGRPEPLPKMIKPNEDEKQAGLPLPPLVVHMPPHERSRSKDFSGKAKGEEGVSRGIGSSISQSETDMREISASSQRGKHGQPTESSLQQAGNHATGTESPPLTPPKKGLPQRPNTYNKEHHQPTESSLQQAGDHTTGTASPPHKPLNTGLPQRPKTGGEEHSQPTESSLHAPSGPDTERSRVSRKPRIPAPPTLRERNDTKSVVPLSLAPVGRPEPLPEPQDKRQNTADLPKSSAPEMLTPNQDKKQTGQPLPPLAENMTPRGVNVLHVIMSPPVERRPESNKPEDLFGKTKSEKGVYREIGSPTSQIREIEAIEQEMRNMSRRDKKLLHRRSSDSLFTDDKSAMAGNAVSDKDASGKVNKETPKNPQKVIADKKNGSPESEPLSSVEVKDGASKMKKDSRVLSADKENESTPKDPEESTADKKSGNLEPLPLSFLKSGDEPSKMKENSHGLPGDKDIGSTPKDLRNPIANKNGGLESLEVKDEASKVKKDSRGLPGDKDELIPKDPRKPTADENGGLESVTLSSLAFGDEASRMKQNSRGLPDDKEDKLHPRETQLSLPIVVEHNDHMSPIELPAHNGALPARRDVNHHRDERGLFGSGSDKMDEMHQLDSRSLVTDSPTINVITLTSSGQDQPRSITAATIDKKSGDKETGRFARGQDEIKDGFTLARSELGPGRERGMLNHLGSKDQVREFQPSSLEHSPTTRGQYAFERRQDGYLANHEIAGGEKNGLLSSLRKDKDERRQPDKSPLLQLATPTKDGYPGVYFEDNGTGQSRSWGNGEEQRRGSRSRSSSSDRDSMLPNFQGQLDENIQDQLDEYIQDQLHENKHGEEKSRLGGLFGRDNDVKKQRRGYSPKRRPSVEQDHIPGSPDTMYNQHSGGEPDMMVVEGVPQPGSSGHSDARLIYGANGDLPRRRKEKKNKEGRGLFGLAGKKHENKEEYEQSHIHDNNVGHFPPQGRELPASQEPGRGYTSEEDINSFLSTRNETYDHQDDRQLSPEPWFRSNLTSSNKKYKDGDALSGSLFRKNSHGSLSPASLQGFSDYESRPPAPLYSRDGSVQFGGLFRKNRDGEMSPLYPQKSKGGSGLFGGLFGSRFRQDKRGKLTTKSRKRFDKDYEFRQVPPRKNSTGGSGLWGLFRRNRGGKRTPRSLERSRRYDNRPPPRRNSTDGSRELGGVFGENRYEDRTPSLLERSRSHNRSPSYRNSPNGSGVFGSENGDGYRTVSSPQRSFSDDELSPSYRNSPDGSEVFGSENGDGYRTRNSLQRSFSDDERSPSYQNSPNGGEVSSGEDSDGTRIPSSLQSSFSDDERSLSSRNSTDVFSGRGENTRPYSRGSEQASVPRRSRSVTYGQGRSGGMSRRHSPVEKGWSRWRNFGKEKGYDQRSVGHDQRGVGYDQRNVGHDRGRSGGRSRRHSPVENGWFRWLNFGKEKGYDQRSVGHDRGRSGGMSPRHDTGGRGWGSLFSFGEGKGLVNSHSYDKHKQRRALPRSLSMDFDGGRSIGMSSRHNTGGKGWGSLFSFGEGKGMGGFHGHRGQRSAFPRSRSMDSGRGRSGGMGSFWGTGDHRPMPRDRSGRKHKPFELDLSGISNLGHKFGGIFSKLGGNKGMNANRGRARRGSGGHSGSNYSQRRGSGGGFVANDTPRSEYGGSNDNYGSDRTPASAAYSNDSVGGSLNASPAYSNDSIGGSVGGSTNASPTYSDGSVGGGSTNASPTYSNNSVGGGSTNASPTYSDGSVGGGSTNASPTYSDGSVGGGSTNASPTYSDGSVGGGSTNASPTYSDGSVGGGSTNASPTYSDGSVGGGSTNASPTYSDGSVGGGSTIASPISSGSVGSNGEPTSAFGEMASDSEGSATPVADDYGGNSSGAPSPSRSIEESAAPTPVQSPTPTGSPTSTGSLTPTGSLVQSPLMEPAVQSPLQTPALSPVRDSEVSEAGEVFEDDEMSDRTSSPVPSDASSDTATERGVNDDGDNYDNDAFDDGAETDMDRESDLQPGQDFESEPATPMDKFDDSGDDITSPTSLGQGGAYSDSEGDGGSTVRGGSFPGSPVYNDDNNFSQAGSPLDNNFSQVGSPLDNNFSQAGSPLDNNFSQVGSPLDNNFSQVGSPLDNYDDNNFDNDVMSPQDDYYSGPEGDDGSTFQDRGVADSSVYDDDGGVYNDQSGDDNLSVSNFSADGNQSFNSEFTGSDNQSVNDFSDNGDQGFDSDFAGDQGEEALGFAGDQFSDDQGERDLDFDNEFEGSEFMDDQGYDGDRDLDEEIEETFDDGEVEDGDYTGDEVEDGDYTDDEVEGGEEGDEFSQSEGEGISQSEGEGGDDVDAYGSGDESEEDRGLDEDFAGESVPCSPTDIEGEEGEEDGELDDEEALDDEVLDDEAPEDAVSDVSELDGEEQSDDGEVLDDDASRDIADDEEEAGSDSGTGSDDESGLGESPEGTESDQEQEEEAEVEEQAAELQGTGDVRVSQLYNQPVVSPQASPLLSPALASSFPPSQPLDTASLQNEGLANMAPIRYSTIYQKDVVTNRPVPQSPTSDDGLPAIADASGMEQGQPFGAPVMSPDPDTISQPFSRTAAGPLSPQPPATPPQEHDEAFNGMSAMVSPKPQQSGPHAAGPLSPRRPLTPPSQYDEVNNRQYVRDPDYDVERALTPEEERENHYYEDDEDKPLQKKPVPGPQTFEAMNLGGLSTGSRSWNPWGNSRNGDLEKGQADASSGNHMTLRDRVSELLARGSSSG